MAGVCHRSMSPAMRPSSPVNHWLALQIVPAPAMRSASMQPPSRTRTLHPSGSQSVDEYSVTTHGPGNAWPRGQAGAVKERY